MGMASRCSIDPQGPHRVRLNCFDFSFPKTAPNAKEGDNLVDRSRMIKLIRLRGIYDRYKDLMRPDDHQLQKENSNRRLEFPLRIDDDTLGNGPVNLAVVVGKIMDRSMTEQEFHTTAEPDEKCGVLTITPALLAEGPLNLACAAMRIARKRVEEKR